jgi:hypothetical protein
VPTIKSNKAAYAAIGFPEFATHFQVGGAIALDGPFAFGGEFTHTSIDHGMGSINAFDLTGAYKLELDESSPFSVCPLANVGFRSMDGGNTFSIGAGAGIGTELPISDGAYSLHPYAAPKIMHYRSDGSSLTKFAFSLGANFSFDNYFVGAEFAKVSGTLSDAFFGGGFRLQAGLNF